MTKHQGSRRDEGTPASKQMDVSRQRDSDGGMHSKVLRSLQEASKSASPVTVDLHQLTLGAEQLSALRELCASATSHHVTITNGTILLDANQGVLHIQTCKLSLCNMDIIRVAPSQEACAALARPTTLGPARAPGLKPTTACSQRTPTRPSPEAGNVPLEQCLTRMQHGMLLVRPSQAGTSSLIMRKCNLRVEGDPRFSTGPAVTAMGAGADVLMEGCTARNMQPMLQVLDGAHMRLLECKIHMTFGARVQILVSGTASVLRLEGCELLEQKGLSFPPVCALKRQGDPALRVDPGGTLVLDGTHVCMPVGVQTDEAMAAVDCSGGVLEATKCTFADTLVSLRSPAHGCHLTKCTFSGSAIAQCTRKRYPVEALLCCNAVSGTVRIEECTFRDCVHLAAVRCAGLPSTPPPDTNRTSVHIKGVRIFDCLAGIQGVVTKLQAREVPGMLTLKVEDVTIKLCKPAVPPQQHPADVWRDRPLLEGPAVSATLHKCALQTKDEYRVRTAVVVRSGARIAMADCTVSVARGTAMALGSQDAPAADAVIERTTFKSSIPQDCGMNIWWEGLAPEPARSEVVSPVVCVWEGSARLIECKVKGSLRHCGVATLGAGSISLDKCELALQHPMLYPWVTIDPKGNVNPKDSRIGTCTRDPKLWCEYSDAALKSQKAALVYQKAAAAHQRAEDQAMLLWSKVSKDVHPTIGSYVGMPFTTAQAVHGMVAPSQAVHEILMSMDPGMTAAQAAAIARLERKHTKLQREAHATAVQADTAVEEAHKAVVLAAATARVAAEVEAAAALAVGVVLEPRFERVDVPTVGASRAEGESSGGAPGGLAGLAAAVRGLPRGILWRALSSVVFMCLFFITWTLAC